MHCRASLPNSKSNSIESIKSAHSAVCRFAFLLVRRSAYFDAVYAMAVNIAIAINGDPDASRRKAVAIPVRQHITPMRLSINLRFMKSRPMRMAMNHQGCACRFEQICDCLCIHIHDFHRLVALRFTAAGAYLLDDFLALLLRLREKILLPVRAAHLGAKRHVGLIVRAMRVAMRLCNALAGNNNLVR